MRRIGLLALIAVMGCGDDFDGSLHDDGEIGGHCYPNGTCNVGLDCSAGVCVAIDAAVDAVTDSLTDAPVDAAFMCSDDSAFEPNDTVQTAFQTNVATATTSLALTGLAICPAGDLDDYTVTITMPNMNLEVIVDYAADGPALQATILNAGAQAIAVAVPVTGMPRRIRAYTPNLPTGSYYASVFAPTSARNNYKLTLNVTGP